MPHTTLVTTDQLEARLADPGWAVFDCRHDLAKPDHGRAEYARGHIPGAHFLHLDDDLSGSPARTPGETGGRHPLPEPGAFAARLAALGVDKDTQVIAYDAQGAMVASRLWWMLRWLGHAAVAVLDGGWNKWVAEGRPQSTGAQQASSKIRAGRLQPATDAGRVDAGYVLAHLRQPDMRLVDARAPDRFRGENETLDPVGGRIPGAVNRYFRDNLEANGQFKMAAQLREEFGRILGDTSPGAVVHQCGSGVSACHNILAMEIAGLSGSSLYPGSWSEWCADPSRPVERGA